MSRLLKAALSVGLTLGLLSVAFGQGKPPAILGPGSLLFNPDVQKELKLTKEQSGKLEEALGKLATKYQAEFVKFIKAPPTPEDVQKLQLAIHEDSNKVIAGVLDGKQYKRFKQIGWQMLGMGSLLDPEMQKELKISDEQKKKLEDIGKEAAKQGLELAKKGERSKEKYDAITKEAETKANEVLTADQKKGYKEAMGEKFNFTPPASPPVPKKP